MPTVLRIAGLRFVIWPNDHAPAHVHVFSTDGEAKISLGEPNEYPTVIENRRMARADLVTALQRVFEHRSMLLRTWEEIHG
jgi:hypothetical protein